MSDFVYDTLGFIGLGAMGYLMAEQLMRKLPSTSKIYVFDIAPSVTKQLSSESGGKIFPCSSAQEVAEKSVGPLSNIYTKLIYIY